nr:CDP-alcohol phosphatidyltransferase family protein [bacterium]
MLLLCFPALSPWFYGLYLICGFSDMIDGAIARKTNTASGFGARLDTAADFIFVGVCLVKLWPAVHIPNWLCLWTAVIAVIKIINIISGFVCSKRLVAEHTLLNKITGILLFLFPLTWGLIGLEYGAVVVCCMATAAAIQEGHLIRTGRETV